MTVHEGDKPETSDALAVTVHGFSDGLVEAIVAVILFDGSLPLARCKTVTKACVS